MKKLTHYTSVALALFSVGFFAFSFAYTSPGTPDGFVNDFANVIDVGQQSALENRLRQFEKETSHEVVVVTIPSLQGDYIENYAVKLFEEWEIGKAEVDNGVLLLVAVEDREVRIEVGYGLEGAFVDSEVRTVIQERIIPSFREGDYATGITNGVQGIIEATEGEIVSTASNSTSEMPIADTIVFIFFVLIWGAGIFVQLFAYTKSWWLGGVIGVVAGGTMTAFGLFGANIIFGVIITVILGLIGLLVDFVISKNSEAILKYFNNRRGGGGGWSSGGGFGGSSGGFGGFGGGGSGGGGASGRW